MVTGFIGDVVRGLLVWRRMHSAARSSNFQTVIKFCNICFDKLNIQFK